MQTHWNRVIRYGEDPALRACRTEAANALRDYITRIQLDITYRLLKNALRRCLTEHAHYKYSKDFNPDQPRDDHGRWTSEGDGSNDNPNNSGVGIGAVGGGVGIIYSTPGGVVYDDKINSQMEIRGWTQEQIDNTKLYGDRIAAINYKNADGVPTPATRYVNPNTDASVVIDDNTNQVIQVGESNFIHNEATGDAPGAVMRPSPNVKPSSGSGGGGGSLEPILGKPNDLTNPRPEFPELEE